MCEGDKGVMTQQFWISPTIQCPLCFAVLFGVIQREMRTIEFEHQENRCELSNHRYEMNFEQVQAVVLERRYV